MKFTMYTTFCDIVRERGWETAADAAVNAGCSAVELIDLATPTSPRLFESTEDAKAALAILKKPQP